MSIETNSVNKKAPKINLQYSMGWRITFWSLISAWLVGWVMLGILAIVSLSIGMLSLFAGSLWGFCVFALPTAGWYILGLGPPMLLVAYVIACAKGKPEKKPASLMNRMLAAV